MSQRQNILLSLVAYLLSSLALCAQPNIPEMPVWFEYGNTPYGGFAVALDEFDSSNQCAHALCLWRRGKSTVTWYNRFSGDTLNSFDWKDELSEIVQVDLNGDGILDYSANCGMNIYWGKSAKTPPNVDSVYRAREYSAVPPSYIIDVNHDGIDDILVRASELPSVESLLAHVVVGGKTISTSNYRELYTAIDKTNPTCILDCYTNTLGQTRLITYSYQLRENGKHDNVKLTLWDLVLIDSNANQSLRMLELTSAYWQEGETRGYGFHSTDRERHFFDWNGHLYSLEADTFTLVHTNGGTNGVPYYNKGTKNFEWLGDYVITTKADSIFIDYNVHIGDPRFDTIPLCKFHGYEKYKSGLGGDTVSEYTTCVRIGDLDGDSLPEYAVVFKYYSPRTSRTGFKILKSIRAASPVEQGAPSDRPSCVRINHVVTRNNLLAVDISSAEQSDARMDVYDMAGRHVGTIWQGIVSPDHAQVELQLQDSHLSNGVYRLRLQARECVSEASFMYVR